MTAKIFVLHEHNEWTVHLQNRLKELSLPYELWHLDEGHFDLSSQPPEGVFNAASAHHPTPAAIASHLSTPRQY